RPRWSWQLDDMRPGARQTAYQIVVDDLWDTGKVTSDQSVHIEYAGQALRSRQRCNWKVRIWDGNGKPTDWSQPASWEMGLLHRSDWKGHWIGSHIVGGPYTIPPAPLLRKTFSVDRPVASARLYVTALGLHECHLNRRRIGRDVFA